MAATRADVPLIVRAFLLAGVVVFPVVDAYEAQETVDRAPPAWRRDLPSSAAWLPTGNGSVGWSWTAKRSGGILRGPPVWRDAKGVAMFWWYLMIGLIAVFVVITVVENHRGSKGSSRAEDRHLNAEEKRGAPGEAGWGGGY